MAISEASKNAVAEKGATPMPTGTEEVKLALGALQSAIYGVISSNGPTRIADISKSVAGLDASGRIVDEDQWMHVAVGAAIRSLSQEGVLEALKGTDTEVKLDGIGVMQGVQYRVAR